MVYGGTSSNRTVSASPPVGGSVFSRLGQSLRSFPRLTPVHFASPNKGATQALIRAAKTSYPFAKQCYRLIPIGIYYSILLQYEGKHYYEVQAALKKARDTLTNLKKDATIKSGIDDAFGRARKGAALWVKSPQEADDALREVCGKVWQKAAKTERKVDMDAEGRADAIKEMTRLIDKSSYDIDIWLQRGIETSQGTANFLQIAEKDLRNLTQSQLKQKLQNKDITDTAFVSCGSAKGKGFSGYIFNIYCPKGTKMMYAEPFSYYGKGASLDWNGITKQKSFGYEDEMIIQRGTTFKVIKVEKKGGNTYFDLEVVKQIGD
jgi:hypothetical protein